MDYYQGYEDAMRQARATRSTGLTSIFIGTLFSILYSAFVYLPLLILSYIIANKIHWLYSNDIFIKIGLTVACFYLMLSFIYFLKGAVIGMRINGRKAWILLWVLCVVVTCAVQAIIAHSLLQDFFEARGIANFEVWSWLGAAALGILIYSHYRFLTNVAPRAVFWSYRIGFSIVQSNTTSESQMKPQRSTTYFHNAQMRVSFKK